MASPNMSVAEIARETGKTKRTIRNQCAAGTIPGARKPFGEWIVERKKFKRWWEAIEVGRTWHPSTNVEKSGGAKSNIRAVSTDSRLRQLVGM